MSTISSNVPIKFGVPLNCSTFYLSIFIVYSLPSSSNSYSFSFLNFSYYSTNSYSINKKSLTRNYLDNLNLHFNVGVISGNLFKLNGFSILRLAVYGFILNFFFGY